MGDTEMMDSNMTINGSNIAANDCSLCHNEFCISPEEYNEYKKYVSVDAFEMVLVIINIIVFLTGILGNLLVSQ